MNMMDSQNQEHVKNTVYKNGIKLVLFFGFVLLCAVTSKSDHPASPVPSASPKASPLPMNSPSPIPIKPPSDWNALWKEFLKAQKMETKATEHRNKFETKELKLSQDARWKEFEKIEREARHKFFADHPRGPDRRAYISEFMKRRDALHKMRVEEKAQQAAEQHHRLQNLQAEHTQKQAEFKKYIDKKQIPPAGLWPKSGG